jgi:CTP synthase (UTP-ammonia lyase)
MPGWQPDMPADYAGPVPGVPICVVIDLPVRHAYHVATLSALEHAAGAVGARDFQVRVVASDALADGAIVDASAAVVIGPGSPYRDPEAVLGVIRSARERGVPLVGT